MATLEAAEDFSGGAVNAQVSTATTNFDAMVVGGTPANLIHTNEWTLPGLTRSMKGTAAGFQYGRYQTASHTRHRHRFSYRVGTLPLSGSSRVIYEVNIGSNASIAWQIRLQSNGTLQIRNVTAATDTSALVLSAGEEIDIEIDLNGAGNARVDLYQGTADQTAGGQFRLAATAAANEIMGNDASAGALTATNFGETHIGSVTNATGGHDHFFGYLSNMTDSEIPTPYLPPEPPDEAELGGLQLDRMVANAWTEQSLSKRVSGSWAFVNLERIGTVVPPGGDISLTLEPSEGCWFGAETPVLDGVGSTLTGLNQWESIAGRTPDILHFYKTGSYNGALTASELAQQIRPGKPKPIMYHTWKPTGTWSQIANGSADTQIAACAVGLRNRADRHFFGIWHEPEDNAASAGGSMGTEADFVAMFDHVMAELESQGVAQATEGGKTVRSICYVGYRSHATRIQNMVPSMNSIDVVAWDPYALTEARYGPDPGKTIDDNEGSWPGFYTFWNSSPARAAKWMMLAEWGANHNVNGSEVGFTSQTDEAAYYDEFGPILEAEFPRLKALVHWHGQTETTGGANRNYQMQERPTAGAGFRRMAQLPYFNTADLTKIPA